MATHTSWKLPRARKAERADLAIRQRQEPPPPPAKPSCISHSSAAAPSQKPAWPSAKKKLAGPSPDHEETRGLGEALSTQTVNWAHLTSRNQRLATAANCKPICLHDLPGGVRQPFGRRLPGGVHHLSGRRDLCSPHKKERVTSTVNSSAEGRTIFFKAGLDLDNPIVGNGNPVTSPTNWKHEAMHCAVRIQNNNPCPSAKIHQQP